MSFTFVPEETEKNICAAHLNGKNVNQLEIEFNLSRKVIKRILNKQGILKTRHEINRITYPLLTDRKVLHEMYYIKRMTIDEISIIIGVSTQLIKNAFKELNIKARSASEATINTFELKQSTPIDVSKIIKLYNDGISISSISTQVNISEGVISRLLKSNNVSLKSLEEQMVLSRRKVNKISSKIAKNLRSRLSIALNNNSKRGSAVGDLGCSIEFLKEYLESRFYNSEDGIPMSWSNYGKNGWELDHIKPLSTFDLTNLEQFKEACNYTNLSPSWRADNRAKSDLPVGRLPKRVPLFIITGQSGVGKSWVTSKLKDMYQIISYDSIPKEQHYHYMVEMSHNDIKPIIYDPLRKALGMYRRYRGLFDTKLIVIIEEPEVVKNRIRSRGGKALENVDKFYKKFKNLATKAHFSGTSVEVLAYMQTQLKV